MNALSYFHVSERPAPLNRALAPGAWGSKLIKLTGETPYLKAPLAAYFWEMTLETARIAIDPQLPSRRDCHFLWEKIEDAEAFKRQFVPSGTIYTALLEDESAPLHRGNYSLITHNVPDEPFIVYMPEYATRYWTEMPAGVVEVIYSGRVFLTEMR